MEANLTSKVEIGETDMDESQWHNLDVFLPVEDPAKLDEIRNLFIVNRRNESKNFIFFACGHQKNNIKCKYTIRWRKWDGMLQSKGKHSHNNECPFETITDVVLQVHCLQKHPNTYQMGDDGLKKLQRIFDTVINREEIIDDESEQSAAASMMEICREMGEKFGKLERNLAEFGKEMAELNKENAKVIEAMEEICKENAKLKRENKKFERQFAEKNAEIAKLNRENRTLKCRTRESTENTALSRLIIESNNSTTMEGGTLSTSTMEMIGSSSGIQQQHSPLKMVNQQQNGPITRNRISIKQESANAAEIGDYRPFEQQNQSSIVNEADQTDDSTEMGILVGFGGGKKRSGTKSQEVVGTSSNTEYGGQIECAPIQIGDTLKCNWPGCKYQPFFPSNKFRWAVHWRSHTGERPFKCAKCAKSFKESSTLKKHEMIHSGKKPFKCPICGESFRCQWHLKKHGRRHIKQA